MNKPLQNDLWENIRTFNFDDLASDYPFSKKLQKENNWSSTFTGEAIEEYRKFIFLCCVLPNGASPSDTIDRVWHLHLTYTTNYWIEFCKKTLHKDIHHFPSKGGIIEKSKHTNWYKETLNQYKVVFGTPPPASIWPAGLPVEEKIEIEIYNNDFFLKTVILFVFLTILCAAVLNVFRSDGEDFLLYYFILMVAGITVSFNLQYHKSKRLDSVIDDNFPAVFNPYQIAMFLYGEHRAYQTALVNLIKRNIVDICGERYKLTVNLINDDQKEENPLLPALSEKIAKDKTFTYQDGLALMDNEKLQHTSFNLLTSISKKIDYQKMIVPGIVLLIGFARLLQGMANEKPVTYLVLEIGLFSVIALMVAAQYSYTYLVFKKSEAIWMKRNNNGYGADIINNFTLLGVYAISGFAEYTELARVFNSEAPVKSSGSDWSGMSSSSCSSSDGGSSCGGGCGGCGGD